MNDWGGLLLVLLVIIIVWWLITRFSRQGPEEFHIEHKAEATHHLETDSTEITGVVVEKTKAKALEINLEEPAGAQQESVLQEEVSKKPERATNIPLPGIPGKPDDLTILEGIGPKVNKLLRAHGISTFAQLAQTPADVIYTILKDNGLRFMDPETWPRQAKLAAEGKMDELQVLMDNLKGGRKV